MATKFFLIVLTSGSFMDLVLFTALYLKNELCFLFVIQFFHWMLDAVHRTVENKINQKWAHFVLVSPLLWRLESTEAAV